MSWRVTDLVFQTLLLKIMSLINFFHKKKGQTLLYCLEQRLTVLGTTKYFHSSLLAHWFGILCNETVALFYLCYENIMIPSSQWC